jgi:hypothetical protein
MIMASNDWLTLSHMALLLGATGFSHDVKQRNQFKEEGRVRLRVLVRARVLRVRVTKERNAQLAEVDRQILVDDRLARLLY